MIAWDSVCVGKVETAFGQTPDSKACLVTMIFLAEFVVYIALVLDASMVSLLPPLFLMTPDRQSSDSLNGLTWLT